MHPLNPDHPTPPGHANGAPKTGTLISLNGHTPPPALPPALAAVPNAAALLKALQRRWVVGLLLGLLCAAAAAFGTWTALPPSKYVGRAQLFINLRARGPLAGSQEQIDVNAFRRTQAALLTSHKVLNAAMNKDPKVKQLSVIQQQVAPVDWLSQQLEVDLPAPDILRVSMKGDRSEELTVLINAVVQAYLEETNEYDSKRLKEELEAVSAAFRDASAKLEELQKVRRTLSDAGSVRLLEVQYKLDVARLMHVEQNLLQCHSQLARLFVEIHVLENRHRTIRVGMGQAGLLERWVYWVAAGGQDQPPLVSARMINEALDKNPKIRERLDRIQVLKDALRAEEEDLQPDRVSSRAERLQEQIAAEQKALEALRQQLQPTVAQELQQRILTDAETVIHELRVSYAHALEMKRVLDTEARELRERLKGYKADTITLDEVDAQIKHYQDLVNRYRTRTEQLDHEARYAAPRVRSFEEAIVTRSNDERRRLLATVGAGGGAMLLVLLALAFWEFRAKRVYGPDEVAHGLGLKLVGALPELSARRRWLPAGTGGAMVQQGHFAESVDSIRTMLIRVARTTPLRTVMVTSAVQGEGKTSLASHLAASLARAGRKTLLIDCDLRRPAVHALFDLPLEPGFAELLRGEVAFADALQETPLANLWVIPAGRGDLAALQALAQDGARPIFAQARQGFDFTVVDSCPVLPVADALLIAPEVDGVLFAVLREVSRLPKVYAAYHRLAALGARILGAVVNGSHGEVYNPAYVYSPQTASAEATRNL
jgi:capsular exopolysaccharide synthesis family protein